MQYSVATRVHNVTIILSYLHGFRVTEYVQKIKTLEKRVLPGYYSLS